MRIFFILLVTGVLIAKGSELINEKDEAVTSSLQSRTSDGFLDIDCNKGEFQPLPNECGKFVHCWNGIAYVKSCSKSLHFSAETHICHDPRTAHCEKNLGENGVCSAETFIPNKEDCTTFFAGCSSGTFVMLRCPSDLHFSPESERCLFPCEAKCDKNLDCNLLNRKSEFECPSDDGRYGDPYDCSIYHECLNLIHKVRLCKRGKYFDSELRQCTGRRRARCLYQCQKRKGRFPHPKQCDLYIHCRNNKGVVKRCPIGQAFNANKQECVRMEETGCSKNKLLDVLKPWENIKS